MFGLPVNITCMSDGFPQPSYALTHNNTGFSNRTKYTIQSVTCSDSGTYKCIAVNELGNDSACRNLTVVTGTPKSVRTTPSVAVGAGIVAGVLVLGGIVGVVIHCCKPKIVKRKTVSPSGSDRHDVNQDELSDNEKHDEGDNVQDTMSSSELEASESETNPSENALTPVYVSLEKSNREGKLAE